MMALVRTRAYLLAMGVVLSVGTVACGNSTINGGDVEVDASTEPDASPEQAAARVAFDENVEPLLTSQCSACHGNNAAGVGFMEPNPDMYGAVVNWINPLLDFMAPANSLLLTKGAHVGPAWEPGDSETVRVWIALEAIARGIEDEPPPTTALFVPEMGPNEVSLEPLGMPDSTVSFLFEPLDTGAYLSEIKLNAGTGGAKVTHPLFVAYVDGVAVPDPVDRFSFVDLGLEEGESVYIGGGTFVMTNFPAGSDLLIIFETAERLDGQTGGNTLLECLEVATFSGPAKDQLLYCGNCHSGTDMQATAATDMRQLNNPNGQPEACGQILSRINLRDPANSGLFKAPDPESPTFHPYKFGTTPNGLPDNGQTWEQFQTGILEWANLESIAHGFQESP